MHGIGPQTDSEIAADGGLPDVRVLDVTDDLACMHMQLCMHVARS